MWFPILGFNFNFKAAPWWSSEFNFVEDPEKGLWTCKPNSIALHRILLRCRQQVDDIAELHLMLMRRFVFPDLEAAQWGKWNKYFNNARAFASCRFLAGGKTAPGACCRLIYTWPKKHGLCVISCPQLYNLFLPHSLRITVKGVPTRNTRHFFLPHRVLPGKLLLQVLKVICCPQMLIYEALMLHLKSLPYEVSSMHRPSLTRCSNAVAYWPGQFGMPQRLQGPPLFYC